MAENRKIEEIGKIKLDLTLYPGQDLYCDGAVEDELLELVKTYPKEEFPRLIEEKKSWPVLYHLSPLRQNIVDWIPMKEGAKVLEVGSGCGAITGALSRKAGEVTCVELSKKRSLINAYRNQNCENVTIYVGNFTDIEPHLPQDYDYICLIGVFEYGQSYIQGENPYETFLKTLLRHLASEGRLIIAIENKYGLKYFAGCQEDHLGTYFGGIENYKPQDGVRTFGRRGLEKIFEACGVQDYSFYYPYPDYKFMTKLYSDAYLPGKGELSQNICNYDRDRMVLFDETRAFDGLIEEELFSVFANSYLVVLGQAPEVKYVKYSNDRAPEYQIRTQINQDEKGQIFVTKHPLCEEAREHIRSLEAAYDGLRQRYEGSGLLVNDCKLCEENGQLWAAFEYVQGVPLGELLDKRLKKNDLDGFYRLFGEYVKRIGYNNAYPVSDFDMVFSNILVQDDAWTLIDYEWTFGKEVEPVELAYRAVHCYLMEDPGRGSLDLERMKKELGITQEQARQYEEQEVEFQKFVTGQRKAMSQIRELVGGRLLTPVKWMEHDLAGGDVLRMQVYEDKGEGYSEERSYFVPEAYRSEHFIETELTVDRQVHMLRIDPAMDSCVVKIHELTWNGTPVPVKSRKMMITNGKIANDRSVIFETRDPNINLRVGDLPGQEENKLKVRMEVRRISKDMAEDLAASVKKLI